jgi:S1-C subfamily serine protease
MGINGVAVLRVLPGSPAAKAGLEAARLRSDGVIVPGDIITKINGVSVESVSEYQGIMDNFKNGDAITISVHRHGETLDFLVDVNGR